MTHPPATRGMTSHPGPVTDPQHPSLITCSRCSCLWRLDASGDQPKDEWCAELDPDGGCQCHRPAFMDGYLNVPVIVDGEEVIGYIGFTSFADDPL